MLYKSIHMKEQHKNIGELLRQRRTEMNVSLQEAESATSIRVNYLQAIEEGHTDKLISPVYAQGFIRQYASFLGLDGDSMIRNNPELFARSKREPEFSYGIGTLEARGHPGSGVKWLPSAVWVISFGLLLFIAWVVAHYLEVI